MPLKESRLGEIQRVIERVAAGEYGFTGWANDILRRERTTYPFEDLTQREREILQLLVNGLRYSEMATRLNIERDTVANHATKMFAKLGVNDKTAAVLKAISNGISKSDDPDAKQAK